MLHLFQPPSAVSDGMTGHHQTGASSMSQQSLTEICSTCDGAECVRIAHVVAHFLADLQHALKVLDCRPVLPLHSPNGPYAQPQMNLTLFTGPRAVVDGASQACHAMMHATSCCSSQGAMLGA